MEIRSSGFSCPTIVAFVATASLVAYLPRPAFAWGAVGHKVVARIAWDNLKPETRTKLIALLNAAPADSDISTLRPAGTTGPDSDRALFEMAATWPDIIKSQRTDHDKTRRDKYSHGNWHYKDLFFEQDETTGKITDHPEKQGDKENSIERLSYLTPRLGDATVDMGEKAVDLAWIEHLTGDVSMPLHNVGRITPLEPNGDQGGNLFRLGEGEGEDRGVPRILHAYWDGIPDFDFPEQTGEDPEARLGRIAAAATTAFPKTLFDEAGLNQLGHFDQWNYEGAEVAKTKVYTPLLKRGQQPPDAYAQEAKQTALIALAKAGYRLAATLEAALATKN